MKIDINEIIGILHEVNLEPEQHQAIVSKLAQIEDEIKAEKSTERKKKSKKEFVITLKSSIPLPDNVVAAVWEMPPDSDVNTFVDKLRSAVVDQNNASKKGKLETFTEALGYAKPKFMKEHGIKRVSGKEWLQVQQVKEALITE